MANYASLQCRRKTRDEGRTPVERRGNDQAYQRRNQAGIGRAETGAAHAKLG